MTRAQRSRAAHKAIRTRLHRDLDRAIAITGRAPPYLRDIERERSEDFDRWSHAHLGAEWSRALAAQCYPVWFADALVRHPEWFDPYNGHPFTDDVESYFASGSNHPGEIEGLARAGWNVGVAVPRLTAPAIAALFDLRDFPWQRIFVDSGAFSEVDKRNVLRVVRPITDAEWRRRLALYRLLASGDEERDGLAHQLWLVAPDRVAHQVETLNRQARYAPEIRELARLGAHVIVPVQSGPGDPPLAVAWMAARLLLGPGEWIAGIPCKKNATKLPQIIEFVTTARPAAVHLLGLGSSSPRFHETIAAVRAAVPGIEVTCDSVALRRMAGRTNGAGGKPRALTAADDEARRRGIRGVAERKCWTASRVATAVDRERQAEAERMGWFDPELVTWAKRVTRAKPPEAIEEAEETRLAA